MDSFVELANDYPYMWALYAVAIALPFVLCACCCVRSKPAGKPKKDEAAERKKTDAPSPDDPKAEKEDKQSKSEEKEEEGSQKKEGEEPELESPVEDQAEVSHKHKSVCV